MHISPDVPMGGSVMKNIKLMVDGKCVQLPDMPEIPHHTPTPWKVDCIDTDDFISGADNNEVIRLSHYPSERNNEDAAFIVRAVNCHEMLLSALKDATRMVTELIPEDPEFPEFVKFKRDLLEAIAKAESL